MIDNIRLQHFRSYYDETFEFGAGVNIIVGPNASGKTNLLEALLAVSLGGSYRVSAKGLIQFDEPWARLDAVSDTGLRILKLERAEPQTKRTYEIPGQVFKRLPHNKTLPVVLFEPEHLRLLGGSPERRREYLDDLLEQTIPGFNRLRSSYKRALMQRNALLKRGPLVDSSQLFVWNLRLSDMGGQIAKARHELVEEVAAELGPIYAKLSGGKVRVGLEYDSAHPRDTYSTHLLHRLESGAELDYIRGFTAHGPHRDDLRILVDDRSAQDVASRGEVRTLLLCLKIVELRLLEAVRGQKPLLLLDDVFSELDGKRRQALTKYLQDHQTFITTTDADVVIQHFMEDCTIIPTAKTLRKPR